MIVKAARQTETQVHSKNPLDDMMTRAQVVRRRFKSGLPRKPENRELSAMEAMARTMELFDKFRNEMEAAGLSKDHVECGLVFFQPRTKGQEHVLARTIVLPKPEKIGDFANAVMAVDRPVFLGLIFLQHDIDAGKAGDVKQENVLFGLAFTTHFDAAARVLAARTNQQAKGGLKKLMD